MVEIPKDFFPGPYRPHRARHRDGPIAVGMTFLPRTDLDAQERCRRIVESEVLKFGYTIHGWRQVPIDPQALGEKAGRTRPEIEQVMIEGPVGIDPEDFERDLYVIRRRIENRTRQDNIPDLLHLLAELQGIIYKGMFLAEQLSAFYPDLLDERFVSRFALYHQRYSTNTFRPGASRSPSACSRTTARSTRFRATSTGWRATKPGWPAPRSEITSTMSGR